MAKSLISNVFRSSTVPASRRQTLLQKRVMICGRTPRMRMQSRSRNWSLIRPWGCESALRKWHTRRSVGGCGSGAGRVR